MRDRRQRRLPQMASEGPLTNRAIECERMMKRDDEDERKANLVNQLDLAGQIGFVVGLVLLGVSVVLPMRPEFKDAGPWHELLTIAAAVLAAGSLVLILGMMAVRFSVDWGTAPWRISLRALVVLVTVVTALFGMIVFAALTRG